MSVRSGQSSGRTGAGCGMRSVRQAARVSAQQGTGQASKSAKGGVNVARLLTIARKKLAKPRSEPR